MRTEIKEIQIEVEIPGEFAESFKAIIRNGKIETISNLQNEIDYYPYPKIDILKSFVQFLSEVIQTMEEN